MWQQVPVLPLYKLPPQGHTENRALETSQAGEGHIRPPLAAVPELPAAPQHHLNLSRHQLMN